MEVPRAYESLQTLVRRKGSQEWFAETMISAMPGQRILDVGCGTASILEHLVGVDYVGIDHNSEYIKKATARFGSLGKFYCIDLNDPKMSALGTFDIVLLQGVLHHIDDEDFARLMTRLPAVLRPMGILVTFDPAIVRGQHLLARFLAKMDRGRFARTPEQYRQIIETAFDVETEITRNDLMNVPYTHTLFRCRLRP